MDTNIHIECILTSPLKEAEERINEDDKKEPQIMLEINISEHMSILEQSYHCNMA